MARQTADEIKRTRKSIEIFSPEVKSLTVEANRNLDANLKLQPAVNEWFLEFRSTGEAMHALTLKPFDIQFKVENYWAGYQVNFIKPAQDSATRATFRKIGALVDRLKEIDTEYEAIGAVRHGHMLTPGMAPGYVDRSYFQNEASLKKWEEILAAGGTLDDTAYFSLHRLVPVDMNSRKKTIKLLYDEECHILIEICKFRVVDKLEFYFDRDLQKYST